MSEVPDQFRTAYDAFWARSTTEDPKRAVEAALLQVEGILARLGWRPCFSSARKKSVASLWDKWEKMATKRGKDPIANLDEAFRIEDLLGGRLVVLNLVDVRPAVDVVAHRLEELAKSYITRATRADGQVRKPADYIADPTPGGHRAIHVYFVVAGDIPLEIQVLTECADFWTRWDHFLKYKPLSPAPATIFEGLYFKHTAGRLALVDAEVNDIRLDLSYWRPASAQLPSSRGDRVSSPVPVCPPSWASKVEGISWLAAFAEPIKSADIRVSYERKTHGFSAKHFDVDRVFDATVFDDCCQKMRVPKNVKDLMVTVLRDVLQRHIGSNDGQLYNGHLGRLVDFDASASQLSIWLQQTTFFTFLLTNNALSGATASVPCHELGGALKALDASISPTSIFANNLALNITLVTADEQIVIVQRGKGRKGPVISPSIWSTSASGDIEPKEWTALQRGDLVPARPDRPEFVSPILGAIRELSEELGIEVDVDGVGAHALVIDQNRSQPVLLVEAVSSLHFTEILELSGWARDRHERHQVLALPIDGAENLIMNGGTVLVRGNSVPLPGYCKDPQEWAPTSVACLLHTINHRTNSA